MASSIWPCTVDIGVSSLAGAQTRTAATATAAAAAVIDTYSSHDVVATAQELRIDCDVAGTGAQGAIVEREGTVHISNVMKAERYDARRSAAAK